MCLVCTSSFFRHHCKCLDTTVTMVTDGVGVEEILDSVEDSAATTVIATGNGFVGSVAEAIVVAYKKKSTVDEKNATGNETGESTVCLNRPLSITA